MARIPNNIQKIIFQYLASLKDHGFHIQDAILFGSYARGNANQWSDKRPFPTDSLVNKGAQQCDKMAGTKQVEM